LEKDKQLIKTEVDEAKLQTDQANKAKVVNFYYSVAKILYNFLFI